MSNSLWPPWTASCQAPLWLLHDSNYMMLCFVIFNMQFFRSYGLYAFVYHNTVKQNILKSKNTHSACWISWVSSAVHPVGWQCCRQITLMATTVVKTRIINTCFLLETGGLLARPKNGGGTAFHQVCALSLHEACHFPWGLPSPVLGT